MSSALQVLLPVGSLIAGSLLTMFNQRLSDNRAYRRERQAKRDDFRIRRFEIDRDTLLQLQDLLVTYEMMPAAIDVDEGAYHEAADKARMLAERCLSDKVRDLVNEYVYQRGELYFNTDWPAPELASKCMDLHIEVEMAIGEELRHDPFSGDGSQLQTYKLRST